MNDLFSVMGLEASGQISGISLKQLDSEALLCYQTLQQHSLLAVICSMRSLLSETMISEATLSPYREALHDIASKMNNITLLKSVLYFLPREKIVQAYLLTNIQAPALEKMVVTIAEPQDLSKILNLLHRSVQAMLLMALPQTLLEADIQTPRQLNDWISALNFVKSAQLALLTQLGSKAIQTLLEQCTTANELRSILCHLEGEPQEYILTEIRSETLRRLVVTAEDLEIMTDWLYRSEAQHVLYEKLGQETLVNILRTCHSSQQFENLFSHVMPSEQALLLQFCDPESLLKFFPSPEQQYETHRYIRDTKAQQVFQLRCR